MSPLSDQAHVLITGSSGAIGSALARELRARRPGARLTLVDRRGETPHDLAGPTRTLAADLAQIDALPDLVHAATDAHGPIDVLVNNAGFMEVRRIDDIPWSRAHELLTVDLIAPLRLMDLVVRDQLARGRGVIVNVSSMAGRVPLKGCTYYGAAKAGLAMASEIAHAELADRGIHVVTVYPGAVASDLERSARAQYGGGLLARAVPTGRPSALARRILDAIDQRRARVIYPAFYELGWHATNTAALLALTAGPAPRL